MDLTTSRRQINRITSRIDFITERVNLSVVINIGGVRLRQCGRIRCGRITTQQCDGFADLNDTVMICVEYR